MHCNTQLTRRRSPFLTLMIAKNNLTGSGFCSISEAPKFFFAKNLISLLSVLVFRDFLNSLSLAHFYFEIFFSFVSLFSHNF